MRLKSYSSYRTTLSLFSPLSSSMLTLCFLHLMEKLSSTSAQSVGKGGRCYNDSSVRKEEWPTTEQQTLPGSAPPTWWLNHNAAAQDLSNHFCQSCTSQRHITLEQTLIPLKLMDNSLFQLFFLNFSKQSKNTKIYGPSFAASLWTPFFYFMYGDRIFCDVIYHLIACHPALFLVMRNVLLPRWPAVLQALCGLSWHLHLLVRHTPGINWLCAP